MNSYEARQEARRARYEERAERADKEAQRRAYAATQGLPPMGEPIKIGHHSERGHRAALKRSDNNMRASFAASDKARHYRDKADGVGRAGISSDDPDAAAKLAEKLAQLEAAQTMMREANKVVRAAVRAGVEDASSGEAWGRYLAQLRTIRPHFEESTAAALLRPDWLGRRGYANYQLTNNSAEIRRCKKRLEQLQATAEAETTEREVAGVRVVENAEENRLQLFFPGKPAPEVRDALKAAGFRWARSAGAWQRHLSNGARYAADQVLAQLGS